ncbi:xanthine dehydrogenase/oxidase-like [Anoplophora glabripennis]|uniref:xanthine dehydrogenase/oxidase-like n=1 Tax=Anoplophora glabripennis TaxID=217634 RepID=UPI0008745E42|nr:xanthine dehydrogenase/oxidase-like [Anoplophora glabripennis]
MEFLSYRSLIKFHVSGVEHTVPTEDVTPETTLNTYLREKAHLTGTKRMCLEGGCGSCLVAVEETVNNEKSVFSVNSCLVSIFSCHGWKIHTVEGIGGPLTKYHPIQRILADNNGTQCGFCSPGMVMNMYALHTSGPVTQSQIEDSFGSNICRCTGYRSILTAFRKLASDAEEKVCFENGDIEDLKVCQKDSCTEDCGSKCNKKKNNVYFGLRTSKWIKVYYLKDLLEILRTSGNANYMLVGGNTARGVYRQRVSPDIYIDVTSVEELRNYSLNNNTLVLGGNYILENAKKLFAKISKENKNFAYLSDMAEHIDLTANVPVRNIGTIAGNLMIKYNHNEFPSDIFLIMETYDAIIVIVDTEENESMVSPQEFLKKDMNKKVIKNIILKGYDNSYKYLTYKIMTRAQNTHALVNAGFLLRFQGEKIVSARIIYGGINPKFVHATKTENYLKGKRLFDNNVLQGAYKSFDDELHPDYVLPDSRPEFRKLLAISLFYKYVLHIAPGGVVASRNKSGGTLLQRPLSSGIQEFGTNKDKFPLGEPLAKVEALAQTSGQAQYIADIPDLPNQLFAAFVTAKAAPNSQIATINTTKALKMKGVVAFLGKDDIPGQNTFTPKTKDFQIQEELFCSGKVQYYDQPIGIIVAKDQDVAVEAAELVEVTYSPPKRKPYLTIKDVLNAKDKSKIHHQITVIPKDKGTDVKHVVKGNVFLGLQYHFHMEVQCCNVVPTEDGLDLYPSSQWMDAAQLACSAVLNIPMNRINLRIRRLGGAFGAKITRNSMLCAAAALAALKLRKPVKMWLPLEKNMTIIGKRYPFYANYEVGVNDKGVIQYLEADLYSDVGVGGNEPIIDHLLKGYQNGYDISRWYFSIYTVSTDTPANCFTRAPGTLEGVCCIDSIMEHIAYSINLDAADVKEANIDKNKYPKIMKYWKDIQTWGDIANRKKNIRTFNETNRWKKKGMSLVPMVWTLIINFNYTVSVSIFHGDGSVVVCHAGIEIGQGINTKVIQVCAYKLGIPISKVSVQPSYNVISPNSSCTGASVTNEGICYALLKACDVLLDRINPIRKKMGNPSWKDLIEECFNSNIQLSASGFYSEYEPGVQEYPIYGVCATEVEVDILTGQHQILRVDIIEDVGDSMSPLIDMGQAEGAFVMGIGYYTTEEIIFNDEGKILTNRTWNYRPPGAKDIPINFRIKFPEKNPNPVGVLKSKAIGEPPMCLSCSVPLAIRNALASARKEAAPDKPKWYPIDGTSTIENTLLNSLNNYKQYVL